MKDIAADLGVSIVTVSKVLRNHSDIGAETRARVLKRIKELNYRPNLTARSLVTGRSYLVGLIVPDLLHPFFAEIAKSLSAVLAKKGYCLIISSSEEDPALEEREIDHLLGRRLDALVIASVCFSGDGLQRIEEQGTPYVLIDRQFADHPANYVGSDDEVTAKLATTHLIKIGCKRIAHIRGPENTPGIRRHQGYEHALRGHGLKVLPGFVVAERTVDVESRRRGRDAAAQLLKLTPRPDGIFCYNDPLAIGAIDQILESGLRVPEDIAVIGCGNLHYDSALRIPLSSIDQHTSQIGERAGRLALDLIKAKTAPRPKSIILEPELVPRRSTERTRTKTRSSRS